MIRAAKSCFHVTSFNTMVQKRCSYYSFTANARFVPAVLVGNSPTMLSNWRNRNKYLLCNEYQDCVECVSLFSSNARLKSSSCIAKRINLFHFAHFLRDNKIWRSLRFYSPQELTDPYEILGVKKNATIAEIKKRYRQLAKKYHPDVNSDKDAAKTMAKISAAYHVLLDPHKRGQLDSTGQYSDDPYSSGSHFNSQKADFNFADLNSFFSSIFSKSNFHRSPHSVYRAVDITTEVVLDFMEAAKGCKKDVHFQKNVICSSCHGTGCSPGTNAQSCNQCQGSGIRKTKHGSVFLGSLCSACSGTGTIIADPCTVCKGKGGKLQNQTLKLDFVPGIRHGMELRVSHEGHLGLRGSTSGDLFVKVNVKSHPLFTIVGDDLHIKIPLRLRQILLGGEVLVPTLEKPVKVDVSPKTIPGSYKSIRGLGMKKLSEGGYGDLIVEWTLELPKNLTEHQKKLLIEFDKYE